MASIYDLGTAAWRRRVGRFKRAGVTVERFCEREGVSQSSFYRWRKLLSAGPRGRRGGERRKSKIGGREGRKQTIGGSGGRPLAFQAVRLTSSEAAVAIQLPGGVRVEVPTANLDVVRAVLGELLRQGAMRDRGESPC